MKKTLLVTVCIVTAALSARAQMPARASSSALATPDVAYVELLGSGLNISLNFERVFLESNTIRIGIGAFGFNTTINDGFLWVPVVPLTVNHYFLDGTTRIEVGAGAIIHLTNYHWETMFPSLSDAPVKGTLELGVRYMPTTSSFVGGVRLTPVFDANGIEPWLGLYLGWGF